MPAGRDRSSAASRPEFPLTRTLGAMKLLRGLLTLIGALLALVFLSLFTPLSAAAGSEVPPPPAADAGTQADVTWLNLDAPLVLFITAALIPFVGGLIIRITANRQTQALVGLVLNALNALLITATTENGDAILSKPLVLNFAQSLTISIIMLYGVYKPLGADDKLVATGGIVGPTTRKAA